MQSPLTHVMYGSTDHPDIRVTRDKMDRLVIVVAEWMFDECSWAQHNGWVEIPDVADGYSADVPDTIAPILTAILNAIVRSPVADERDKADARHGVTYGFITSPSRWNDDAHWWAVGPGATVGGYFYLTHTGAYRFAG